MPGIDKITERILSDAKVSAEEQRAAARQKAAEIAQNAAREGERQAKQIVDRAGVEANEIKRRRQAICDLECRKQFLALKREVMDEVYDEAKKRIASLSEEEYEALLERLLIDCSQLGDGEIVIAARDKSLLRPEFLRKAEKKLHHRIAIAGVDEDISGGFIFRSGSAQIDCTLDEVFRQRREVSEMEVAKILFCN